MHVRARTTYPLAAAGPRVRLAQFVEPLRAHGVEMSVESTLSDSEYATINSDAPRASKARALARAALRLPRRVRGEVPVLIHRLLFLAAMPGIDPPRQVDAYDFDDALFVGSIGRRNVGGRLLKREAARWHKYVTRARLVIAGNEYLASHALQHATGAVEVVPSCVAPEDYELSPHRRRGDRDRRVDWIRQHGAVSRARARSCGTTPLIRGDAGDPVGRGRRGLGYLGSVAGAARMVP